MRRLDVGRVASLAMGGSPGGQGPQLSAPISVFTASLESLQPGRSISSPSSTWKQLPSVLAAAFRQVIPTTGGGGGSTGVLAKPCQWQAEVKAAQLGTDPTSPREL